MSEQLVHENQGLASTSVPATQFLQERMIAPRGNEQTASMAAESRLSPDESSRSPLEKRREELERGSGGDHDLPSLPQVLAWVKLLQGYRRVTYRGRSELSVAATASRRVHIGSQRVYPRHKE
ncbi:MAG: hypothetical protein ACJ8CB_13850 [Ktedonobacteraceae bacterium]